MIAAAIMAGMFTCFVLLNCIFSNREWNEVPGKHRQHTQSVTTKIKLIASRIINGKHVGKHSKTRTERATTYKSRSSTEAIKEKQ